MPTRSRVVADTDPNLLTWPRWLGRAAAFAFVVGLAATMFSVGQRHGGADLSGAGIAAIGGVFAVGGFAVGLWEQIRPTSWGLWGHVVWQSRTVWLIEVIAAVGLGYLVGTIA